MYSALAIIITTTSGPPVNENVQLLAFQTVIFQIVKVFGVLRGQVFGIRVSGVAAQVTLQRPGVKRGRPTNEVAFGQTRRLTIFPRRGRHDFGVFASERHSAEPRENRDVGRTFGLDDGAGLGGETNLVVSVDGLIGAQFGLLGVEQFGG